MNQRIEELLAVGRAAADGFLDASLDLSAYTAKIIAHATIISYQSAGIVTAFIAYYDNAPDKKEAFLTMILVAPESKGKGIGRLLLDASIRDVSQKGFSKYTLEVAKSNVSAQTLYQHFGFDIVEDRDHHWLMQKSLK